MFERTLEFRFDKFYEYWEKRYSIMLTIVFELILNMKEKAILISNIDTELCLFKENGEILLNNQNGIWNQIFFRDMISGMISNKAARIVDIISSTISGTQ